MIHCAKALRSDRRQAVAQCAYVQSVPRERVECWPLGLAAGGRAGSMWLSKQHEPERVVMLIETCELDCRIMLRLPRRQENHVQPVKHKTKECEHAMR